MEALNARKKAYVTPTLADHGKVIARTEGGLGGGFEIDMTPRNA
jgi:hypothetical protein